VDGALGLGSWLAFFFVVVDDDDDDLVRVRFGGFHE
jgi:hypothetical protein